MSSPMLEVRIKPAYTSVVKDIAYECCPLVPRTAHANPAPWARCGTHATCHTQCPFQLLWDPGCTWHPPRLVWDAHCIYSPLQGTRTCMAWGSGLAGMGGSGIWGDEEGMGAGDPLDFGIPGLSHQITRNRSLSNLPLKYLQGEGNSTSSLGGQFYCFSLSFQTSVSHNVDLHWKLSKFISSCATPWT